MVEVVEVEVMVVSFVFLEFKVDEEEVGFLGELVRFFLDGFEGLTFVVVVVFKDFGVNEAGDEDDDECSGVDLGAGSVKAGSASAEK